MAIQVGSSQGGGGGGTLLSEINVTPFVDVMLVLLTIFMVTAPLITRGVEVNLPKTRAAVLEVDESKLLISITKELEVYIGEVKLPTDRLLEAIITNEKIRNEREVYLQADEDVPYGFVVKVMAALKEAGVEQLGLVTNPIVDQEIEGEGGR